MGGNALKEHGNVRLADAHYREVRDVVLSAMSRIGAKCAVPRSIGTKVDHGDLDVLIEKDENITDAIKENFPHWYEKCKINGDTHSVLLETPFGPFQVDLIFTDSFEFHYNYLNFNDFGNLVGRFAHKMGLKFGHDGLWMPVRYTNDNLLGEVLLTADYKTALEFVGFDHDAVVAGFKTFEQMYKFVTDHPKFSPRMFYLEERNHTARVRDRKRPTYTNFLKYIEKNIGYLDDYNWPENKGVWKSVIFNAFPHAKLEEDSLIERFEETQKAKQKINGVYVGEKFDIQGKELGVLIKEYKELFDDWVLETNSMTQEEVDAKLALVLYSQLSQKEYQ